MRYPLRLDLFSRNSLSPVWPRQRSAPRGSYAKTEEFSVVPTDIGMGVPRGHQWEPVHPGVGELKKELSSNLVSPTKIVEIANTVEAVQDGRIYIELINGPFLFREKGTPDEYKAGLDLVDRARLAGAARERNRSGPPSVNFTKGRLRGCRPAGSDYLTVMPFEPCIPTKATKVPDRPEWIHEIKHDGYRLIVQREDKRVRLFTRNGHDWSHRYPLTTEATLRNRNTSLVIDGEAVLLGVDGRSDFNGLHTREHDDEVQFYAFDMLMSDGADLRKLMG
jgi:hypothetical protein